MRPPKVTKAGEQIAALHQLDKDLRATVLAARKRETELAALDAEAAEHRKTHTRKNL
ncbi:hypothetical protein [Aeromicrobium sp. HA]|uniref:hypothetical protein n=1 Tax=Aeromicrobium sp. HA TaxID=3009077 RepID=UPI0022AF5EA0|nr:hypothetical protein [Aeromicrobium sp. HA]